MNKLNELMFKYLTVKEQADNLYLQAKQLEKEYKAAYEHVVDECGRMGKTIDDLEE